MSFIDKIWIKFGKKQIGADEFGNKYFIGKGTNYLGQAKRFVIYNGKDETSKVPPIWHAWLHYLSDVIPNKDSKMHDWQQEYTPNLTGTKHAYDALNSKNNNHLETYSRWIPNN